MTSPTNGNSVCNNDLKCHYWPNLKIIIIDFKAIGNLILQLFINVWDFQCYFRKKKTIFYLLVKDNFSRNRRKIAHRMEYFQMACVNFKNGRRFENYPFLRLTFKSRFWYLITPFGVKSIVNCHLYKPAFEGFGRQQLITNKCAVYSPPTMIYRAFNFYDSAKWLATLQASRENSSWLM